MLSVVVEQSHGSLLQLGIGARRVPVGQDMPKSIFRRFQNFLKHSENFGNIRKFCCTKPLSRALWSPSDHQTFHRGSPRRCEQSTMHASKYWSEFSENFREFWNFLKFSENSDRFVYFFSPWLLGVGRSVDTYPRHHKKCYHGKKSWVPKFSFS